MKEKQKIIAIVGASATGKTKLAIELAKFFNGEIISVDSRQIYKELNVGSAKPTIEEREGIAHHLIDITSIEKDYTVANFYDNAQIAIKKISQKNKIPILAGGTGLYFRVLLQDFDLPRVAPNSELRRELEKFDSKILYEKLCNLDFELSKKIHPNNRVKIIRALEVSIAMKRPMSSIQNKKESEYDTLWIGLNTENRNYLYDRINKRVDIMLKKGLLDEVESLYEKFGQNKILSGTIGYQEFFPYLKNESTLENSIELIKQNTRRYAKRQISWFKANKAINWFDVQKESPNEILYNTIELYNISLNNKNISI